MIFYDNYAYHQTEDSIEIYMPAGSAYYKYTLKRFVKLFTDGGTHQNLDLWRLYELYLCKRVGDSFENIYDFRLVNNGEWECALKIHGTPDFHGGFHGYEHQTDISINPTPASFEFTQLSDIILQGTEDDVVATHKKHYLFADGQLTLTQTVEWKKSVTVNPAYMCMLPIRRKDNDFQITDTAIFENERYDVSEEGHDTPLSHFRNDIKKLTLLGKSSGIVATVSVDFDCEAYINNSSYYNKFYFNYLTDKETKVGECWNTVSVYKFDYLF